MENDILQPRTAIITGASSGIGLGMTRTLLERGYQVVANSRTITKSPLLTASGQLVLVDGDIGEKETAGRVVDAAMREFGGIDLLVNNAGIFFAKPFIDFTEEDFSRMVATNLAGFFYVSQLAIAQMCKRKSGHVVSLTTSIIDHPMAGVLAGLTHLTKGGVQSLSKALALEYVAEGIRVNMIAPGVVDTPMHANEDHEELKKFHPIPRLGTISEIVDALLYLEDATFVTGQILYVDGGSHVGRW